MLVLDSSVRYAADTLYQDRDIEAYPFRDFVANVLLYQALAPYAHKILAVDSARNMTIEYNKIAEQTKDAHPNCEMRAFWGDLIKWEEPNDEPWATEGVEFNLIAVSVSVTGLFLESGGTFTLRPTIQKLGINYSACSCCGVPGLQDTLQALTSRLEHNGTLLVLDVQKDYTQPESAGGKIGDRRMRNGRKLSGFGSEEVETALEALGMEGIEVLEAEDLRLRFEKVGDGEAEVVEEVFYLLKAKKGGGYRGFTGSS